MFKNIALMITDWSGVVSDDRRPVYEANMFILESFGRPRMTFEDWLSDTTITPRGHLDKWSLEWGAEAIFNRYQEGLVTAKANGIHPTIYSDAKRFLEHMSRKVQIVVVSSHPETHLYSEADRFGLNGYI